MLSIFFLVIKQDILFSYPPLGSTWCLLSLEFWVDIMIFKMKCLDPAKEAKLLIVKILPMLLDMGKKLSLQVKTMANG